MNKLVDLIAAMINDDPDDVVPVYDVDVSNGMPTDSETQEHKLKKN